MQRTTCFQRHKWFFRNNLGQIECLIRYYQSRSGLQFRVLDSARVRSFPVLPDPPIATPIEQGKRGQGPDVIVSHFDSSGKPKTCEESDVPLGDPLMSRQFGAS
ncbi:hypothetical protein [uncultured Aliiroseovarius sp.]|uniref:hypothetical protein n=1 Tax=uncultured Aliiroseovarius sp. TaxID=1658783 RepID=UPI0026027D0A|nr:hypothetical protein [uncultured Aliiroseovarius sp.]